VVPVDRRPAREEGISRLRSGGTRARLGKAIQGAFLGFRRVGQAPSSVERAGECHAHRGTSMSVSEWHPIGFFPAGGRTGRRSTTTESMADKNADARQCSFFHDIPRIQRPALLANFVTIIRMHRKSARTGISQRVNPGGRGSVRASHGDRLGRSLGLPNNIVAVLRITLRHFVVVLSRSR
jgi:hypothetical protein